MGPYFFRSNVMSRLVAKGLPPRISESQLRKHFDAFGMVTDCSMKYTKDGRFRRMAFIGYNSDDDANKALHYFNGSYIGTQKIVVELCRAFSDDGKPRAWSKYAPGSSAYKRLHPNGEGDKQNESEPSTKKKREQQNNNAEMDNCTDKQYEEFLRIKGNPTRQLEETTLTPPVPSTSEKDVVMQLFEGVKGDMSASVVISGLPVSIKQTSLKQFLAPVRPKIMRIVRNEQEAASLVTLARKPDQKRVLKRDKEYLGGFQLCINEATTLMPESLKSNLTKNTDKNERNVDMMSVEETAKLESEHTELIMETGRLFARNLSYTTTLEDIERLFAEFGPTTDVKLPMDRNGKPKGFAFVTFMFPEHAVQAYTKLDGSIFKGRMLHLIGGKEAKTDENNAKPNKSDEEKSSFKKDKQEKQKQTAASTHNWNSLFLGASAVADMIAKKLDAEKGELLDAESGANLAVRMALGETRLVRETREFLLRNGVQLDSFSRPKAPRSKTVILVKNLPAGTTVEALRPVFERFGELGRVLLPPEGGISALVEYSNTADAAQAFKALAYSRFGPAPLFLEWAPGDVFGASAIAENEQQLMDEASGTKEKKSKKRKKEQEMSEDVVKEESQIEDQGSAMLNTTSTSADNTETKVDTQQQTDVECEPDSTLFVKNLNFETSDEALRHKFADIGELVYATVSRKNDPKRPGERLSMGYGFVQYKRRLDAQTALKQLQGALLNGHCLELKLSNRQLSSNESVDAMKRRPAPDREQGESTKILVRNVPFQAQANEIEELFSAFGELSFVRLPQKVGGRKDGKKGQATQHRGFAFVQFQSMEAAKRAFDSLCHSTHLYGRRLVLEWADTDADLQQLRAKTIEHFATGADRKKISKTRKRFQETLERIDPD